MFLINHKVRKFHEADSFEDVRYRSTFWRFQKIPHKFPTFVDEYVNSSDVLYRNIKERNLLSLPPHYSKYHQVIQIFEPPAIPPLINSLNPKLPSGKQYKISIIKLTRTPWKSHKYDQTEGCKFAQFSAQIAGSIAKITESINSALNLLRTGYARYGSTSMNFGYNSEEQLDNFFSRYKRKRLSQLAER